MNRRVFLSSIGVVGISGLAGCSQLDTSSSSASPLEKDPDGDGVPTKDDYAPWDESVQIKQDVIDQAASGFNPTPESNDVVKSILNTEAVGGWKTAVSSQLRTSFVDYTSNSATLKLDSRDTPQTEFRVLFILREFPTGRIREYKTSEVLKPDSNTNLEVTFENVESAGQSLYFSAYLLPPTTPLQSLTPDELTYIHETDPFVSSELSFEPQSRLDELQTDRFTRIPVEGGYIISVSGRTNGRTWTMQYFVSQSEYVSRVQTPRGRQREEYVRLSLSKGAGDELLELFNDMALRHGFTTNVEKAELAVDFVQSLPYIEDSVGTGYDDYTKFIEETLCELGGDCEDSTVVLSLLLEGLGFNVVLVEFPNHIGVGVAGNENLEGSYIPYNNSRYYYIETTSEGWGIGDFPKVLNTQDVEVLQV